MGALSGFAADLLISKGYFVKNVRIGLQARLLPFALSLYRSVVSTLELATTCLVATLAA